MRFRSLALLGLCLLLLNSGYLAAFANPSLFYMSNVMVHVVLGVAVLILLPSLGRGITLLFLPAIVLGIYLAIAGATTPHRWALQAHIVTALLAALAGAMLVRRRSYALALAVALVFPIGVHVYGRLRPNPANRIVNPAEAVAATMEEEANGPQGKFFPSSATTPNGNYIPSNFFMESQACQRCHQDIYKQWQSSMHHFASFNNQFYRKSIEYMQETAGVKSSKWCAGCHDHALFFNGKFETPIKDRVHTPEAQAGLGCMSCHAIVHVKDTAGNGGFTVEYPPLHDLANSKNKVVSALHDFLIYADPEPHRRAFLKPFMRQNSAEFCSSCHKVHLDVPVNSYRWIRGFNEYDNWQASGVSGQGARSFYYPPKSMTCTDCHMQMVASNDAGNRNGMIHSHRFAAANTAVPFVNQDREQLAAVEKFLKDGQVSVDIFAVARGAAAEGAGTEEGATYSESPRLSTTFAVGEEADSGMRGAAAPATQQGVGPIDVIRPVVRAGDDVRVDVVVRTRKVGHFFPGGTVDAFDVWVELKAADETGQAIFWSGALDNGNGPVEKSAHMYRSFLLDAHGNPINKRNAFQARSTLYVRLIPPGAADTIRYRLKIPKDARGKIRLEARVNYRKFSWYYTNFAYAGVPDAAVRPASAGNPPYSPHYDDRNFVFTGDTSRVSGKIKSIPDLPVVAMAEARAELDVAPASAPEPQWKPSLRKDDRERWNDYGIGLLLQGDLKGAAAAFKRVTECDPQYADGWLNVARVYVQEGNTEEAKPWLQKAAELGPKLARVHFFLSQVRKADGDYDGALAELRLAEAQYPRDRVVLNQVGRILFLQRKYADAVAALQRVVAIDPEDIMAHYNLMLGYRGLGNADAAAREEKLYRRFKADEASQTITGDYRRLNPEDNNERQMIHEHTGILLIGGKAAAPPSRPAKTVQAGRGRTERAPKRRPASPKIGREAVVAGGSH